MKTFWINLLLIAICLLFYGIQNLGKYVVLFYIVVALGSNFYFSKFQNWLKKIWDAISITFCFSVLLFSFIVVLNKIVLPPGIAGPP